MNNNFTDNYSEFDFSSFDDNLDASFASDDTIYSSEFDNSPYSQDYNDTLLYNNDTFDVGNFKNSNYNRDTIDEKNEKKPSEMKKYLSDINTIGDKKNSNQIEYTNNEYLDKSICTGAEANLGFYELDIDDYPKRNSVGYTQDINNKSLGASDESNFIIKIINKIKGIIAR